MSLALLDATTFIEGFDFTTRLNELSLETPVESLDDNRFGGADTPRVGRSRIAGLEDVTTELNGFWEAPVDEAAFSGLGTADQVVTHSVDGSEQSTAYLYMSRKFTYEKFGEVGSNTPFTVNLQGSRGNGSPGAVRGQVGVSRGTFSATNTRPGTELNLGTVAADEFLYATLHLFSVGTSITIEVYSAPTVDFASPTLRATIGPLSETGGTWMSPVAGAISDEWYKFEISAITGTFTIAGAMGIK